MAFEADFQGSDQVMWNRRMDASNALYVAARRFCRRFEDLEETRDANQWQELSTSINDLRLAVERATGEIG